MRPDFWPIGQPRVGTLLGTYWAQDSSVVLSVLDFLSLALVSKFGRFVIHCSFLRLDSQCPVGLLSLSSLLLSLYLSFVVKIEKYGKWIANDLILNMAAPTFPAISRAVEGRGFM